jgi:poly-beta-1,6-N-acetyl-D-glucosamine synthase
MFEKIIISIFTLSAVVQLLYWCFVFSRLAFYKTPSITHALSPVTSPASPIKYPPVSIIICARNEAKNLSQNLVSILQQKYAASFEVIVVNDASTDETAALLNVFSTQYSHLKIVHISEKKLKGKKGALAEGIKASSHDWLLLTDADCTPLSKEWLSDMIKCNNAKDIGLGFSPYKKRDGFLNTFIRYEAVWTAIQYMGFGLAGMPYMGVGRNILYNKKIYEKANGFAKHAHIASGDDDLFINSVISKKNFSIILSPKTFMYSEPNTQWNGYFTQKKRHFTTATSYKLKHKIILGGLSVSHIFYFVTSVLALTLQISTIFVLSLILVRTLTIWFLYGKILLKFHDRPLIRWIPLLDTVYFLFYLVFAPALVMKAQKWN